MKKRLWQWIKKIFSDMHALVIATIMGPLLTMGSIYLFAKSLWIQLKIIVLSPMPLWVSIALAFLSGLLVYVIQRRIHSYDYKKNKDFPISIGNFKWLTYWIAGDCYGLVKTPYCIKHDLQMYKSSRYFLCHGVDSSGCKLSLSVRENEELYKKALILVEKKLRKKKMYLGSS